MVFSSMFFLFLFLVVTLAAYFLVPARYLRARNLVLLAASLFFYFFGEPVGILLMLASIAGNYFAARLLDAGRHRKAWLTAAVLLNLLMLGTFKYADFFAANFNALTGLSLPMPGLAMPIGISFFTFQGLSYVLDVYRRRVPAQRSLWNVATYISMFPQLVAGPIVRYETVAAELDCRRETIGRAADGAQRFIYGLAKKMLLSNAMGEIASAVFAGDAAGLSAPLAWTGAAAYTFQIFFDFSGYSDMAIGLGHIFGFTFPENFRLSLYLPLDYGVLAALAHVSGHLVPRLRIYPPGRFAVRYGAANLQHPDRLGADGALARRGLELRRMGALLRPASDAGKALFAPMARTRAALRRPPVRPLFYRPRLGAVQQPFPLLCRRVLRRPFPRAGRRARDRTGALFPAAIPAGVDLLHPLFAPRGALDTAAFCRPRVVRARHDGCGRVPFPALASFRREFIF